MEAAAVIGLIACAGGAFFIIWYEKLLNSRTRLIGVLMLIASVFLIRAVCLNHVTLDYVNFLSRWVQYFRTNGGFRALNQSVGNYNLPYLYFLAIFSHSDVYDLYLIKLLSIAFDVLLAWGALRLVSVFTNDGIKKLIAFFGVLFLPTVVLNGAYWGQCDSSYTAFAVWSIYFALKRRGAASMIAIALSFAFKLQAIFVMPVFLIFLFANRIKLWHFILFPLTYIVTVIPAVVMGRPFIETITLYFNQAGSIGSGLNYNSPSVYAMIRGGGNEELYAILGIVAAFAFLALLFAWFYVRKKQITDRALLGVALLMAISVPFLLPHMHDRYFFQADVLSLCFALVLPHMFPAAILCSFASLLGYHAYLKMQYLLPMKFGSLALIIAALLVIVDVLGQLHGTRGKRSAKPG